MNSQLDSENHEQLWQGFEGDNSTSSHVLVPLLQNRKLWGNVELRFEALNSDSFFGFVGKGIFKLAIFCLLIGFFAYLVIMLTPALNRILSYTQSCIQALQTRFFPITAVITFIGRGLPKRVFSIVELS